CQHPDGRWDYSFDPATWKPRIQNDWHQGFVIDSLLWTPMEEGERPAILGGIFYKRLFSKEGMAYMRHPVRWPADLHNQAQGIISFSRLSAIDRGFSPIRERVLDWTIDNFLSPRGYFYYQKHRLFINKIPYVRWQAWMLYALGWYLCPEGIS
ncbi:MAG: hypothetical protein QCI38_07210, partial [Candidatus Thermoplasmatota archaeon]|nr:hypothetical protein [Candidatus Thermoplasmatota archaeon]